MNRRKWGEAYELAFRRCINVGKFHASLKPQSGNAGCALREIPEKDWKKKIIEPVESNGICKRLRTEGRWNRKYDNKLMRQTLKKIPSDKVRRLPCGHYVVWQRRAGALPSPSRDYPLLPGSWYFMEFRARVRLLLWGFHSGFPLVSCCDYSWHPYRSQSRKVDKI